MPYQSLFVERHQSYVLSVYELYADIAEVESIYQETHNEKALRHLRKLQARLQSMWDAEIQWNKADLEELMRHPGLYSTAAVVAAYMDRDQEFL